LRGVQRRCVWVVGRLGVAACLACVAAAAVDRQARLSCPVWCGGVNCELTVGQVRSGVGVRPAVALRRPTHTDADQTQNAPVWRSDRLSSHGHTRHDESVQCVSCWAWPCELAFTVNMCYICCVQSFGKSSLRG